jgi:hypothetical protein
MYRTPATTVGVAVARRSAALAATLRKPDQ